jgi:hypothetical protein
VVSRTIAANTVGRAGEPPVHDPLDGRRAASALGVAAEAHKDCGCAAQVNARGDSGAHVMVGKHVAGADDHDRGVRTAANLIGSLAGV